MSINNEVSGTRPEQLTSNNIITELAPKPNSFKKFGMTEESMKAIDDMEYLIDGLIVKGIHTYLFGNAGGGKTTIAFFLAKEILQKFKNMNVVFFYIDGTPTMAKKAMESFIDLRLDDRMTITNEGTVADYIHEMEKCIASKEDLSNTFFIFSRYSKLFWLVEKSQRRKICLSPTKYIFLHDF